MVISGMKMTARADNGRQVDNENAGDDDSYDVNAVD